MKFTFAASDDRHITWTGAAIKDDRFLYPWNDEVCSFTGNSVLDPPEPVKYNSPVPCINCGDRKCVNFSHLLTVKGYLRESNILLHSSFPGLNISLCTHAQKMSEQTQLRCLLRNLPLYSAEFTMPPPMARARPNFPMDSKSLAMTAI